MGDKKHTDLNVVIQTGRLGRDIELRHVPSGKVVADFSLAVTGYSNDTHWIDFTAWEKTAEILNQHTKKGDKLTVKGCLRKDSWDDSDGNKKHRTFVLVESIEFMGEKKEGSQQQGSNQNSGQSSNSNQKQDDMFADADGSFKKPFDDESIPF